VVNQPSRLDGYNLYTEDRVLGEALGVANAAWANDRLAAFGAELGGEPMRLWGTQANEFPPRLRTHDRYGKRIDEVEFHPAYHQLMTLGVAAGVHALPWLEPIPGAHPARAALLYLLSQVEAGVGCPLSMTYSAVPALRMQPESAREWEPRLTSLNYDPTLREASQKSGALCGMAMTEKQGGSDVRANQTRAQALGARGPGEQYALTGHNWFCSAPMSDAFLVLAQADKGLSCFFLPRVLPDGTRNRFHLQRLKDKLGNRANASAEVEFDGAWARMIGEEGRGVPTILEMVNHTRLDCVIGSAATMRQALSQAIHHARHRSAFGRPLVEQPLMQNVLADLCLETEAAVWLMTRLATAYDARAQEKERQFARLATAVGKYWVCKRAPIVAGEALECLGGNGFVEESGMPRLFRDSPLNSIWEGSGNVICLDVLRTLKAEPAGLEALIAEVQLGASQEPRLARWLSRLQSTLAEPEDLTIRARAVVEMMALALQASLLVQHAPPAVAEAFCASRLIENRSSGLGTLPVGLRFTEIIERSTPHV
jgi:putative acyl-CoA dehydrogenase